MTAQTKKREKDEDKVRKNQKSPNRDLTITAARIGDDYLQKQAYGRTVPDSFNHGTSAQRSRWLRKGLSTGNINLGDTFSPAYSQL